MEPSIIIGSFKHAGLCPVDKTRATQNGEAGVHQVASVVALHDVTKEYFVPAACSLTALIKLHGINKAPRLKDGYSLMVVHSISQGKNKDGTNSQRNCRATAAVFMGSALEKDVADVKRAFIEDAQENKLEIEAKPVVLDDAHANLHMGRCRNSVEGRDMTLKRNAGTVLNQLAKPVLLEVFRKYYQGVDEALIMNGLNAKGQPKGKNMAKCWQS